jgi:sugar O-acyltransferase (sialic acid O-acetyltransferase NeuD family)
VATGPRDLVIVGAGENAEIACEYFTHDSPYEVVGFAVESAFVDKAPESLYDRPVVPFEELARRYDPKRHMAFVALSSMQLNRVRRRLYEATKAQGFACASYVSSHAFVWRNVTVGENTFVFEHNVLQHHVSVGDNVILWSGNHVGHRTRIDDHCFIASHVVISGYCSIGEHTFMGVNSTVADGLSIGADAVVGAGAVVVRDLDPRGVYVGNPARASGRDSFESFGVEEC